MGAHLTWGQALAWRMRRHRLDPLADLPPDDIVRELCGVQAQVASSAELAIRLRQQASEPGEVNRALDQGRLIKTWAMRGTLHLLAPEDAGTYLSLLAAGRSWERPSWEKYFGMTAATWDLLRPAVREALDGDALTREELIAAVTRRRGLAHLGEALRSGWGTVLKPLAWQGDLCYGPPQGGRVTFTRPERASATWRGLPEPEQAAASVVAAYLRAYGPATATGVGNWLSRGRVSKRQLSIWFEALGDRLAAVEIEGTRAFVLAEDVDDLHATTPTKTVRLLAGFDQYVLGPGTADSHVVPASRRAAVSRQAGWISPVVVAGGAVCGTWELDGDDVRVAWFTETGKPRRRALAAEVTRLSSILERDLRPVTTMT